MKSNGCEPRAAKASEQAGFLIRKYKQEHGAIPTHSEPPGQETEEKNSVRDQIVDQVEQRIERTLCFQKESRHGRSGWRRVSPAEKDFMLQDWFLESLSAGKPNK